MGTRGIMGIRIDGQDKLNYNHFDSYPSYLGVNMARDVKDILANSGIDWFKEKARALKMVDHNSNSKPSKKEIENLKQYADLNVSDRTYKEWYVLLRNLQGELKQTLEAGYMIDDHGFIRDSLFCEWAYIVNLDEMTFEVYVGFQKKRHNKGRYAKLPPDPGTPDGGMFTKQTVYYPCALVATYPLESIPEGWEKEVDKDV